MRRGGFVSRRVKVMEFEQLSDRVAKQYADLSPQLQRAARFALDHPEEVALMSMRRLAAAADVHPSTMVRLCQAFGFGGFEEFREPFRRRLRGRPDGFTGRARGIQTRRGQGKTARLVRELHQAAAANLDRTFGPDGVARLLAVSEGLHRARRVYVVGLRGSLAAAHTFYHGYRMIRGNAVLVGVLSGTEIDDLRSIGQEDVVLAFGYAPYSKATIRVLAAARRRAAAVMVVTDSAVSPLTEGAQEVLVVGNESPGFFQSVAASVAVAEALVVLLVSLGGRQAVTAIEEIETDLMAFDAFWRE